ISFLGALDGAGQSLSLTAGSAGNIGFSQVVGGSGALGALAVIGANTVAAGGSSFNVNALSITATTIAGTYNVGAFTFNAPNMNAQGTVGSLTGLNAAYQIADLALTSNQFFNGFALMALPPLPPPPLPIGVTTVPILTTVTGQLRIQAPSADSASGINSDPGGGYGYEVSISAHDVDWDDPVQDLPIKPTDYLTDLQEFFSGRFASGGREADKKAPTTRGQESGAAPGTPQTTRFDCRNGDSPDSACTVK